jgi:hypothetical protein
MSTAKIHQPEPVLPMLQGADTLTSINGSHNILAEIPTNSTRGTVPKIAISEINFTPANGDDNNSQKLHHISHISHLPTMHLHLSNDKRKGEPESELNEESLKKSESTGFLSTIINAAQSALAGNSDESHVNLKLDAKQSNIKETKEHSFAHKLESLLKPSTTTNNGSKGSLDEKDEDESKDTSKETTGEGDNKIGQLRSAITASKIQFESVRESPLNTLGQGNLSLDIFDNLTPERAANALPVNSSIRRQRTLSPAIDKRKSTSLKRQTSPGGSSENLTEVKHLGLKSKQANRSSNTLSTVTSTNGSPLESIQSTQTETVEERGEGDEEEDEFSNIKFSSEKRNKEFHQLFKKVPKSEVLIDTFSCALSKDILVQGRMFLTKNYICFNSNILGWVTHLVIPLQEVIQIEKRSTAVLFPNGIVIRTLHQRYVFATFLSRDTTFSVIRNVWHQILSDDPSKQLRYKRVRRSIDSSTSHRLDDYMEYSDSEHELLDEEDVDTDGSDISLGSDLQGENVAANSKQPRDDDLEVKSEPKIVSGGDTESGNGFNGLPSVGPKTHEPTDSGYTKQAGETFICEETVKAPLGVVFMLLYGPDKSYYVRLVKEQKNFDVTEETITGLNETNKERSYSYVKPLSGPIGPKQTKCLLTDKLEEYDLNKCIVVESITQTPDVPSGNSFKVRSKQYFSWGPNNSTKVYCVTAIDWTGKSWIKGAIEKGSIDGQKESMKATINFLNSVVSAGGGKSKKGTKKTRSRRSTISKKVGEKEQSKSEEVTESQTVILSLMGLAGALGKVVPVPMVGDTIVGMIIMISGFIISSILFNKIFLHSGSNSNIQFLPGDTFISKVKINEHDFLIMPTVDTTLKNEHLRMENEVNLWKWLEERSAMKLSVKKPSTSSSNNKGNNAKDEYNDQVLRDVIKITESRLRRLSEGLEN